MDKNGRTHCRRWKGLLSAVSVMVALLLGGCAHRWSPGQAPPVALETVGPFEKGYSVHLSNNQPDNTYHLFGGAAGHTHYANYNEWTDFYVKYWGDELAKRGVEVTDKSPHKIAVKLDDFLFVQGFAVVRTNMRIHFSSPDGWKKDFEETDTSGWSMGRVFGSLIYHSVEKVMKDPEVMGRMKPSAGAK